MKPTEPKKLDCWKTSDGKLFENQSKAVIHQEQIKLEKLISRDFTDSTHIGEANQIAAYVIRICTNQIEEVAESFLKIKTEIDKTK